MVRDNSYVQLISDYTTDNKTIIDHIYCKMTSQTVNPGILETSFSDHKTIWLSYKLIIPAPMPHTSLRLL